MGRAEEVEALVERAQQLWMFATADALAEYADLLDAAEELLRLRDAEHWPGVYGHDEFERLRKLVRP